MLIALGLHSICHGIGIMIITYQYLAQLHDQQDEYHLNQASNADGTQTTLGPLKLGTTYLGIALV